MKINFKIFNLKSILDKIHFVFEKNNNFYEQLFLIVLLIIFYSFCFPAVFFYKNSLLADKLCFYSYFYDILHSLNYFGEIAWWNPVSQNGFPQYYTAIVGLGYLNPLFMLIAVPIYILGKLGIYINSFIQLYILYFAVLEPILFLISIWLFSRQIFKNRFTIYFILITSSFSPGLIINLTDIGFSNTAYGLLFAVSFLNYYKNPSKINFLILSLASMAMSLLIHYYFLFWNVIFLPFFAIFVIFFIKRIKSLKLIFPLRKIFIICFLSIVCLSPTIISFKQGEDTHRKPANTRIIEYFRLSPGNSLRILSASVPGLTFCSKNEQIDFASKNSDSFANEYNYMGILVIPLALIGFCLSKSIWKYFFLGMTSLTTLIFILSGYSPLFSLLLSLPTPIRAMSHFGGLSFYYGYFYLLLFSAGIGFDILVSHYRNKLIKKYFLIIFGIYSLISLTLIFITFDKPFASYILGFIFSLYIFYILILFKLYRVKSNKYLTVFRILLVLILIDVSTLSFIYLRKQLWTYIYFNNITDLKDPDIKSIGIPSDDLRSWYSRVYIGLNQMISLEKLGINADFPLIATVRPHIYFYSFNGTLFNKEEIPITLDKTLIMPIKYFAADINGDKKSEILFINDTIQTATIDLFIIDKKTRKLLSFNSPGIMKFGDINGDGSKDILYLDTNGSFITALSKFPTFEQPAEKLKLHSFFTAFIGAADINGDSKDDAIFYDKKDGGVYVSFSSGSNFSKPSLFCAIEKRNIYSKDNALIFNQIAFGDVNGDGREDLICHIQC